MSAINKRDKALDITKLQAMVEPLTVRCVLKRNGVSVPVPLPSKTEEGQYPTIVSDYTSEDIVALEQFLLNQWTGGGLYKITITDTKGDSLDWEFGYPTTIFPERVPPPMMAAANQNTAPAQATAAAQMYGAQAAQAPSVSSSPFTRAGVPSMSQPVPPLGHLATFPVSSPDDRVRQLERQLEEEKRSRLEQEYQRKLEDERRKFEAEMARRDPRVDEMARMRDERERDYREQVAQQFRQLQELIAGIAQAPRQDTAMLDRLRQLEDERKRDREEYERRTAEERHRQELRDLQLRQEAQMAELKAQMAQRSAGDPMIEMMREQLREMRSQFDRMAQFMVTPTQIASLVKDTSSSADVALNKIVQGFGSAFDVQARAMEHIAQLTNPGGSPVVDVIKDGLEKFGGLAQDYVQAQRDVQVSQAKAQQEAAKAQAEAMRAAAQAGIPVQQAQQQGQKPPAAPPPLSPDLAGAKPVNGQTAPAQPAPQQPVLVVTDEQLFGPAYPHIVKLRERVAGPYTDDRGKNQPALTTDQAAEALIKGIAYAEQHGILEAIPAFQLLQEDKDQELVHLVFPRAAEFFCEAVLKSFRDQLAAAVDPDTEDADDAENAENEDLPPEVAEIAYAKQEKRA